MCGRGAVSNAVQAPRSFGALRMTLGGALEWKAGKVVRIIRMCGTACLDVSTALRYAQHDEWGRWGNAVQAPRSFGYAQDDLRVGRWGEGLRDGRNVTE